MKKKKPELEHLCRYCERAAMLSADQMLCEKKGVVSASHHCRAFRYDPLKRDPPAPQNASPLIFVSLDENS